MNKSTVLIQGGIASFGTYFCMYAFRKPFTVATYEGLSILGVDYKICLILAQVIGYMLAKFIGIKVISELRASQRLRYLIAMIVVAELALLCFGWLPLPYNAFFLFINGLSLGMIWGVVFSYLEGREGTEILGVTLCSSFILSGGAVKSIGIWVMSYIGVSEFWMPAVTGAIFVAPFILFALLLQNMPSPTEADIAARTQRKPMTSNDRLNVLWQFRIPVFILVIFYVCLTAIRDFRDNFSREIWDAVGFAGNASIYTLSELPVALIVLVSLGLLGLVKNNFKAFVYYHYLLILGISLAGVGTLLFQMRYIGPTFWMINAGTGLYLCYVPFNCIFFDRMVATFKVYGNAGFLIYIADAFGYLGSMSVLLYKNFARAEISWLKFFVNGMYFITAVGLIATLLSLLYFQKSYMNKSSTPMPNPSN